MSDFSRLPQDELARAMEKGYVGIYFEQGVPILDRDLNLMQDLVATTVRSIVGRYIGDGVPAGAEGFEVVAIPAANDFRIAAGEAPPGRCLVGGVEVTIAEDLTYGSQGLPPLTTPPGPQGRSDVVYLDVSVETVDGSVDDDLLNAADVGVQTSVRLRPVWRVRVAEDAEAAPPAAPGHAHFALARLDRPAGVARIEAATITDLRQTRLNLDDVERRMAEVERLRVIPRLNAPPNEFEPRNGGFGGQGVTIFGRNLDLEPVRVRFGEFPARVTRVGPTEIVAEVPSAAHGRLPITVSTAGGEVTTQNEFRVRGGGPQPLFDAPPDEFDPVAGPAETPVTLSGVNFGVEPVSVQFDTVEAPVVSFAFDRIVAKVPRNVRGRVRLTVKTGAGTVTSAGTFAAGSPPAFSATAPFSPTSAGVGGEVVLAGTNLDIPPVTVAFGTVPAEPESVSEREIRTRVPQGASGRVKITVTTGVDAVTSTAEFRVLGS
ncbi:MAG TPA: IPT/TIG domain-containing protein [Solirubrobacteraceae bacterium]|nr:IPT/TIG domain-containing protein [Solirubrobacteraceae bacterium]